jgi:hypothetical protein
LSFISNTYRLRSAASSFRIGVWQGFVTPRREAGGKRTAEDGRVRRCEPPFARPSVSGGGDPRDTQRHVTTRDDRAKKLDETPLEGQLFVTA